MKTATLVILLNSVCWSEDSLKGVNVIPFKKNMDTTQFKQEGATIHQTPSKGPGASIPFTKETRDSWLAKTKISFNNQGWDEFGKDELVIRSIVYTPDRLIKAYPKLEASELLELQKISQRESKNGKQK